MPLLASRSSTARPSPVDADRKGYLIPNEDETALVNFAFDRYLATGSIKETLDAVNGHGHRTKTYASRRGKVHSGSELNFTSLQYLLSSTKLSGSLRITTGRATTAHVLCVTPTC